jgi:hypothetical protein
MDKPALERTIWRRMRFFKPPTHVALNSALSPKECAELIRDAIDRENLMYFGLLPYRGSKPFVGEVDRRSFRLRQRDYIPLRISFPPVLTAEFQPHADGTTVSGTFDLELTSKIAVCFFSFCSVLLAGAIAFLSYEYHPMLSVVSFIGCSALAFFFPRFLRELGITQEKRITDFLKLTLEANEVPPSGMLDAM